MELTNLQRRCMGIEEISSSWERVEIGKGYSLFFDNNTIRKEIFLTDNMYCEYSIFAKTTQNRTMLCPRTKDGKETKLTLSNLQRIRANGNYFSYTNGHVLIGNMSNQTTYYSSKMAGLAPMSFTELEKFLERWVAETDASKLAEVQTFSSAKRKHCKFEEGDFFRYRIDRTHFGYGRILLDVTKLKNTGVKHWDILMGKPLIVQVYHIVTQNSCVTINELKILKACPSQYIMDNNFYYGDYEIVGNAPITEEIDYPIMYGRSISPEEPNKIIFQRGKIYKEISLEENKLISGNFRNNGIGYWLHVDKNVLIECMQTKSNEPFWNRDLYVLDCDLRNPKYNVEFQKVLEQFA